MEERIIDDEYGRGVRLKKTKDGYVDVTDEAVDSTADDGEEIAFEFPTLMTEADKDDEDLVDLSPEEAERVRKEKAEAAQRRLTEYKNTCDQGAKLLEAGSFRTAEMTYEKALQLDDVATEASVGYWEAKTENFTNPDVLISEYVEAGIESLEFDLGYDAAHIIKQKHRAAFEKRVQELTEEEAPLAKVVEEKQEHRREILSARKLRWGLAFVLCTLPVLAAIIATIVIGLKNFGAPDNRYVTPTIILGCVSVVLFVAFMIVTNKYINAGRMYRLNERLSATEDGRRLVEIREYKELYEALLAVPADDEEEENEE